MTGLTPHSTDVNARIGDRTAGANTESGVAASHLTRYRERAHYDATGTRYRAVVDSQVRRQPQSAAIYKYVVDNLGNNQQPGTLIGVSRMLMGGCPWTRES